MQQIKVFQAFQLNGKQETIIARIAVSKNISGNAGYYEGTITESSHPELFTIGLRVHIPKNCLLIHLPDSVKPEDKPKQDQHTLFVEDIDVFGKATTVSCPSLHTAVNYRQHAKHGVIFYITETQKKGVYKIVNVNNKDITWELGVDMPATVEKGTQLLIVE